MNKRIGNDAPVNRVGTAARRRTVAFTRPIEGVIGRINADAFGVDRVGAGTAWVVAAKLRALHA